MARYIGLWYGGCNYATPDPQRDGEPFDSVQDAARTLQARIDNDNGRTPCVEGDTELHLYRGEYTENGPDRLLTVGPRGGIRVERC